MTQPRKRTDHVDDSDRPGINEPFDERDTQRPNFEPSHEDDSHSVSSRLDHTAGRDDSRAEGAHPDLHKPAAADEYAHGKREKY
jgi:hypothetical protein